MAILAAMCLITFLFLGTGVRFRVVAADLVPNLGFEAGLRGWDGSIDDVRLIEEDGGRVLALEKRAGSPFPFVVRNLTAPQRFTHLRIGAQLRTKDVVRGEKRLQNAAAALWSFDAAGKRLRYWPGELALLAGDNDWRRFERILPVHDAAAKMRLYVYIGGRSGRLWARDLTVEGMAEAPGAATARIGLMALWVLVALWAAAPLLAQAARRPGILLILVVGLGIAAGTLTPQPQLSRALGGLIGDLRAVIFPIDDGPPGTVAAARQATRAAESGEAPPPTDRKANDRKTGDRKAEDRRAAGGSSWIGLPTAWPRIDPAGRAHLLAFALLGFLIGWVYRDRAPVLPFAFTLLVAVSSEVLQYFTPSRDTEGSDLLFNMLGAGAGLVLASLARRLRPWLSFRRPA